MPADLINKFRDILASLTRRERDATPAAATGRPDRPPLKVDILTLFPDFFASPLQSSMIKRAREAALLSVAVHDIRAFATDRHRTVDDAPYGGGPGMVMKTGPLMAAIDSVPLAEGGLRVYLSPDGQPLCHELAVELASIPHLVLLCGHYEGIDQRVRETCIHREVSIGDYVLTGGEPAALVLLDAVIRFIPGVLGDQDSAMCDSFADGLLDHPHYTRPAVFNGQPAPAVLLSGHHDNVRKWRRRQQLVRTARLRPDLLLSAPLSDDDRAILRQEGFDLPPRGRDGRG